jgi:hypothetical protein
LQSRTTPTNSMETFREMPDTQLTAPFELRHLVSGATIHAYVAEAAALGFVRDVIRVRGRNDAACFALICIDKDNVVHSMAEGEALVARALEDRVL